MMDLLAGLLHQYRTELLCFAVGTAVAITLTEVARFIYFPKDWDITDQWRAIVPVDFFATFGISHALWRFLDPADAPGLRLVGCLSFGVLAVGVHVFGLRFALRKWPWIAAVDPNKPAGGN